LAGPPHDGRKPQAEAFRTSGGIEASRIQFTETIKIIEKIFKDISQVTLPSPESNQYKIGANKDDLA
jgi:hypothetical protein